MFPTRRVKLAVELWPATGNTYTKRSRHSTSAKRRVAETGFAPFCECSRVISEACRYSQATPYDHSSTV